MCALYDFSDYLINGRPHPSGRGHVLRAGPLEMLFDGESLRHIRLGSLEIARRIHVAVRDCNWGTVPSITSDVLMDDSGSSFQIRFAVHCEESEIQYRWDIFISGSEEGSIAFHADGVAISDFLTNRTGICVLHPIRECAGKVCQVTSPAGLRKKMVFPDQISATSPFEEFVGLHHEIASKTYVDFQFEGEIFEMEDQRNWTDASFKTFSTPLRLPHPWLVKKGDRVSQRVHLGIKGDLRTHAAKKDGSTVLTVGGESRRLPQVGVGMAGDGKPLRKKEIERLRRLHLDHLRVDLDLSGADWRDLLRQTDTLALRIGAKLEIAVHGADTDRFFDLANSAAALNSSVVRWLISPPTLENMTSAREHLSVFGSSVVGGTNDNFAELNEAPPLDSQMDAVYFSINPQIHATDDLSLIENLESQSDTVFSAKCLFRNLPVVVSPVTLKPRRNSVTTLPRQIERPLPETVDPRQISMLAASWTLGSIKYLSEAGASSITYFETVGWRGLMERKEGCPRPGQFRSRPGSIFPVYIVFALLAGASGGIVRPVESTNPLCALGLDLQVNGVERFLAANLTESVIPVTAGRFHQKMELRTFDDTVVRAIQSGASLDSIEPQLCSNDDGWCTFELPPYSVAALFASMTR